jgi:hypothetical protein
MVLGYEVCEHLREADVPAHMPPQPFGPIGAEHEPQLEGPETPPEWHLPVPVVNNRAGLTGIVAEVLRRDGQGIYKARPVGNKKAVAVEVGEQPLVRVERIAVGQLQALVLGAQLRTDGGRTGHGGVDVEPDALATADISDSAYRVEGHR